MKYSIIVPMYNLEKYIEECILSLTEQTFSDLEIIIVDDESEDRSLEVCNVLAEGDSRINVIQQKHSGVGTARNTGLAHATGDYVFFVDGDDFLEKDYIEQVNSIVERKTPDIVITNHMFIYNNETKKISERTLFPLNCSILNKQVYILDYIVEGNYGMPGGTSFNVYKRGFIEKHKCRFPMDKKWSEDLDFFFQVITHEPSYEICEAKYYYYRRNISGSSIATVTTEKLLDRIHIYEKWYDFWCKRCTNDETAKNMVQWISKELYSVLVFSVPLVNAKVDYKSLQNELAKRDIIKNYYPILFKCINILGLKGSLIYVKINGYLKECIRRTVQK